MISHERAEQLISARMDAPLTPGEHHELQAHLAGCPTCRLFVGQADDIARGLIAMPRLAPSPAVSRAVMSHVREQQSGWAWLRNTLQALSSPGMAAVASMALIVALAGVLYVAVNAPGRVTTQTVGQGVAPEETIAAIADAPLPTEIPTRAPEPKATQAPALAIAPTQAPEPTATREARTVQPAATKAPATKTPVTPTPAPVATEAPVSEQPAIQQVESPPIQPVDDGSTYEEPATEDPALAMASEPAADQATVELAQEADPNAVDAAPVEAAQGTEPEPVVEQVSDAPADDTQVEQDNSAPADDGSQGGVKDEGSSDVVAEPEPTRPTGTLPLDTIAALNGVGPGSDVSLPPPPMDPMQPDQSFLPVTPTPVSDGTPTPEQSGDTGGDATGSEAPQLADAYEDDGGITALLPDSVAQDPALAEAQVEAPADTWTETTDERNRDGKKDKDRKKGDSSENPQTAWGEEQPLAWTGSDSALMQEEQPVVLAQESDSPVEAQQTTGDTPVYDDGAGTTDPAVASDGVDAEAPADGETADAPQIDPATGMAIDPATGYLIDPNTGYLLDRVNGRVIDPRTSYEVHVQTGLLIDPSTGALLDPNTLQVVVPGGFFDDDTPNYDPNDPAMRGEIETVVDDNYNNASIKMEPPTDGPVQPVGPITVPTESGDSVEIS